MPLNDSEGRERTAEPAEITRDFTQNDSAQEEIVTPIEAELEEEVEREFEKPRVHKNAIVSVNGEDVDKVSIPAHDRAA